MIRKLKTIPFLERKNSAECKYEIRNYLNLFQITQKGRKPQKMAEMAFK